MIIDKTREALFTKLIDKNNIAAAATAGSTLTGQIATASITLVGQLASTALEEPT
jgi:hypothetical protein